MNTSQVVAWLMCLLLAFFGALLGTHNLGSVRLMQRELQDMKAQVAASASGRVSEADLQRMRRAVADLRAEVRELRDAQADLPAGTSERLDRLEALVGRLEQALEGRPAGGR